MSDHGRASNDAISGKWPILERLLDSGAPAVPDARQKEQRQAEYDALNRRLNESRIGKYSYFLNYGYVADAAPSYAVVTPAPSQIDVNSRRLVLEVLGDCPLAGADVLDVSCGRGAVAVTLRDHFAPASYLGIDLSREAIEFCRTQHGRAHLRFEQGDAESLPVRDAAADIVVNIEASHNYPNVVAFFREVYRVLRAGGRFLYTDFLPPAAFRDNQLRLEAIGFRTVRTVDITPNVLLSSDAIGEMRLKTYRDDAEREYMFDFLAVPGSDTYNALRDGRLQYRTYVFERGAAS